MTSLLYPQSQNLTRQIGQYLGIFLKLRISVNHTEIKPAFLCIQILSQPLYRLKNTLYFLIFCLPNLAWMFFENIKPLFPVETSQHVCWFLQTWLLKPKWNILVSVLGFFSPSHSFLSFSSSRPLASPLIRLYGRNWSTAVQYALPSHALLPHVLTRSLFVQQDKKLL